MRFAGVRSDREGVMTTSERMGAISGADWARRIVAMPYSRRAIGRSCCALLLVGAFVGATLALARPVAAVTMIDCNTPNDFCTGDPCMTTDELQITVASCVLDFGTRALVLNQVVFVPNGGSLTLSAGSIEVRRRIDGRHIKASGGDGADVSLTALGNITVRKRVDAAGRSTTGNIVLSAGGNIDLRDQLRARAKGRGATANGGNITVTALGTIASTHKGKIDVHGRINHSSGGHATISGNNGINLEGKIDARGNPAGAVSVASLAGNIVLAEEVRADGSPGAGGNVAIDANGMVTAMDRLNASGGTPGGGTISVDGGGTVTLTDLRSDGKLGAPAGSVGATAGNLVVGGVRVRGGGAGGVVNLFSKLGDVNVDRIDARGRDAAGGLVTVSSAADLLNSTHTKIGGDDHGGQAHFTALGNMTLGQFKGSRLEATGAVGGVLEGHAGGNLTAMGTFEAATGGCIGLSAGGMLNTSGVDADVPITPSCP